MIITILLKEKIITLLNHLDGKIEQKLWRFILKVMNHIIIKCFIAVLLTGCSGLATEYVIDNYYLTKMDYSGISLKQL